MSLQSVLGGLANSVRNLFAKTRQYIFTNILSIGGQALSYPDINQESAIKEGYESNGYVYSIVSKDARKFASIPRCVFQTVKGKKQPVENDLSKLLDRPNEYQGQDAFLEAVRGYYKICGESFIWLNRGDTNKIDPESGMLVERTDAEIDVMPILEMYVLPSNRIYLVPDPQNIYGVLGYRFDAGGRWITIRKNDIIHWKSTSLSFDPYNRTHMRGMPALKPGNRFLQQNNDATDSVTRMHQNDGARGMVYNESMNDLTPMQMSDVRDVVDKRINNNDVKGAVATVQGKWGYLNFGGTAVDMELINSLGMSLEQLCMLFDVPTEFFTTKSTYENKNTAMRGWVIHSIIPACKQLDDELNRVLLKAFKLPAGTKICSDYSDLHELQADLTQTVQQLQAAWWITPNEKRETMSYEPIDDERLDEPWVPAGIQPLSMQVIDDGFNDLVNDVNNDNNGSGNN